MGDFLKWATHYPFRAALWLLMAASALTLGISLGRFISFTTIYYSNVD
jgi:hypothetical protein